MTKDITALCTALAIRGINADARVTGSGHHTLTIGRTVVWAGPEFLRWHDGARWRFHPVGDLDGAAGALAGLAPVHVPRPREAVA